MRDRTNTKCTKCKRGTYVETGIFDDIEGVLHCRSCRHKVERWDQEKNQKFEIGKQ